MDMTEEELADTTASWQNHPFTIRTAQMFEQRLENALHELKAAAGQSHDPKVTAAFARYQAHAEHVAYYKRRGAR